MSRKIPTATKDGAFRLWLQGLAYREIHNRTGMSLGAINQMVAEARAKIPNIEELRELNVMLRKSDASVYDVVRGAKLLDVLNERGVGLDTLHSYIELSDRISSERGVEAQKFIDAGMRLVGLEVKTGKNYEQVLKDFEERTKQIEVLDAKAKDIREQIQGLMEMKNRLEGEIGEAKEKLNSTIQEMNQAIGTRERLRKIGLEKISQVTRFIEDFEQLKFDADTVRELAEWRRALLKMGVDPQGLDMFIREKGPLESQVLTLRTEAKRLKSVVEVLERRKKDLVDENSSLFTVSKILESRRASLPCRRCGWPIPIGLDRKENYMSMINQGLGLGVWCPSCGYQNLFDAREVIFNVGWMILPA